MPELVRETYQEKLRLPPAQEQALDGVLWRCSMLSNAALEQRITAWRRCHVSVTRCQQEAELKAIQADMPEYAAIHSHVLQDVVARLDITTAGGTLQGIHYRYCRPVHRADGYAYQKGAALPPQA